MFTFNVNFANLVIEVNSNYEYVKEFCRDYICDGVPVFSVSVTQEQIDGEIASSPYSPERKHAESVCVYREIAKKLPLYNRMVFHGAVIKYNGGGYMFTAPSGTGKTTHIRLWNKYLDGVEAVNGDKPLLHIENGSAVAYATPYSGKEGYQNHSSVGLRGICVIHRGTENRISRVSSGAVITEIMNQIYLPEDAQAVMKTLELLDLLVRNVPLYLLECDMSEQAVKTSFEALTGEKYKGRG